MFAGNPERGSDEWWVNALLQARRNRNLGLRWRAASVASTRTGRPGLDLLARYVEGDPPLPRCAQGWSDGMGDWLRMARLNAAELVTSSVSERLTPIAVRTAVEGDQDGDKIAARVMAANEFPVVSGDITDAMLAFGDSYAMVAPTLEGTPAITFEDPRDIITADRPGSLVPTMALKARVDEWTGDEALYLHGPGWVRVARYDRGGLVFDGSRQATGLSKVGVVHFRNKNGVGEYEHHLDVLDRINDGIFMRMTVQKYQAHRQIAVKTDTTEDENGNAIDFDNVLSAEPGAMWVVPGDTEFWQSMMGDLNPFRSIVKDDLIQLCSVTKTPLGYMMPDAANESAQGAKNTTAAMEFRIEDRMRRMSGGIARVMSLCFEAMGDTARADAASIRTVWAPTERYSLGERASAAQQMTAGSVPFERVMVEALQATPEELPLLADQRRGDMLYKRQVSAGGGA